MRFQKKSEKPEMKQKQPEVLEGKSLSTDELLKLIAAAASSGANAAGEANRELFLEAVEKIVHPGPTEAQKMQRQAALAERIEAAQASDTLKAHRRQHCVPPANPSLPHRRPVDSDQGIWGGKTVIAWHYSTPSIKTPLGSRDGATVALGVCMWCQTEFRPEDPDYAQAMSWGMTQSYGSYPMHKASGHWSS